MGEVIKNSGFAASILRLWRAPFGLKGRRFYGQAKRLMYAKLGSPMQDFHL